MVPALPRKPWLHPDLPSFWNRTSLSQANVVSPTSWSLTRQVSWFILWHLSYWCLIVLLLLYPNLTFPADWTWLLILRANKQPHPVESVRIEIRFFFFPLIFSYLNCVPGLACESSDPFLALLCSAVYCRTLTPAGWAPKILCQLASGWVWSMEGTNKNWVLGGRSPESTDSSLTASMAVPSWLQPPLDRPTVVLASTG